MEKYTVSARKYRPSDFSSVVGQEHITKTLKNAIRNNQLAQAFLFCGPRGIGKTTCARILAKTVNCMDVTAEGEACNQCDSCTSFNKKESFNFYELDAASNNSVDDIRSLVDQVRFAPQSGKYKVYIIDEVHMLSQSAFNAFLKTLEEPPPYAIFILATTEKHKILPTILSRCQIFDFNRISIRDIAAHIKTICEKENIEAEEDALFLIAQKADGALRDSLSTLDRIISFSGDKITYQGVVDNLNILDYDYFLRMTDMAFDEDLPSAMLLLNEIVDKGFDLHNFLNGLCSHLRDLIMCKNQATNKLVELPDSIRKAYEEQAEKVPESFLLSGLNILNRFDVNFKASKNQRLHLELALMKICYLNQALNLSTTAESTSEPKKKVATKTSSDKGPAKTAPASTSSQHSNQSDSNAVAGDLTSITGIQKEIKKKREAITEAQKAAEQEKSNRAVSEKAPIPEDEKIRSAWLTFLEKLKSSRGSLHSALSHGKAEVTEPGVLLVEVPSKTAEDMLLEEKPGLIEILYDNTGFNELKLDIQVNVASPDTFEKEEDIPKKLYERMSEKNPDIELLREKFNLKPVR